MSYDDVRVAESYDAHNPWHPSDEFYLRYVMAAGSALDAGCGTGTLLAAARERGHSGRLTGLDPSAAMLDVARRKAPSVDWVRGDARHFTLPRPYGLVTMTGHAFQVLLTDEDASAALTCFHRHLEPGGLLVFETRNPAARAWERWDGAESTVEGVRSRHDVDDVDGDLVAFTTTAYPPGGEPYAARSTLRFIGPDALRALLDRAGFRVTGEWGDWDGAPVGEDRPEIIVEAARA